MQLLRTLFIFGVFLFSVFLQAQDLPRYYVVREPTKMIERQWEANPLQLVNVRGFVEAALNLLQIDLVNQRFPAPQEDYSRLKHFGNWVSDPRDNTCYNTRAKVLIRDSSGPVVFSPSNHCRVEGGVWNDPYSGQTFTSAKDIQIDHFIPLKHAYKSGAHRWNGLLRCLYANYLGNAFHLKAVWGSQNMSKSDQDPSRWMPMDRRFHCAYLSTWLKVKLIWGLILSDTELIGFSQRVQEARCDMSWFKWSKQDLLDQRNVVMANLELCKHRVGLQNNPGIPTPDDFE